MRRAGVVDLPDIGASAVVCDVAVRARRPLWERDRLLHVSLLLLPPTFFASSGSGTRIPIFKHELFNAFKLHLPGNGRCYCGNFYSHPSHAVQ